MSGDLRMHVGNLGGNSETIGATVCDGIGRGGHIISEKTVTVHTSTQSKWSLAHPHRANMTRTQSPPKKITTYP